MESPKRVLESHETAIRPKVTKKINSNHNANTPKKLKKIDSHHQASEFKFEPGSIKFGQIKKNRK